MQRFEHNQGVHQVKPEKDVGCGQNVALKSIWEHKCFLFPNRIDSVIQLHTDSTLFVR